MATKKYLSLERLAEYDGLIKQEISDSQAVTLSHAKSYTDTEVAKKANVSHSHDDLYYTETEIDTKLSGINTSISNITNGTVVVKKAEHAVSADSANTSGNADKLGGQLPSYYAKASDIPTGALANKNIVSESDLDNALAEKVNAAAEGNHSHSNKSVLDGITSTKVSAWDSAESNAKAYADSAATTAANKVKNDLLNGAGEAYDTLKELGELIDVNVDAIKALETVASGKADKAHEHAIGDITNLQTTLDELSEKANDSATFVVNITVNEDGTFSADKTFDEIKEAYESGKVVSVKNNGFECKLESSSNECFSFSLMGIIDDEFSGFKNVIKSRFDILNNNSVIYNEDSDSNNIKIFFDIVSGLDDELDSHNHNDLYYTQVQVDTKLEGKADATHSHAISEVTGLQSALDGKAAASHGTHVTFDSTNKPKMDGTAAFGTSTNVARADHVHPTDTSRASKSEFDTHTSDTTKHITSTERTNWGAAYTHSQAAHAPSNAQANVIESIKVNGTAQTISSKSVNITVPTSASDIGAAESTHKHAISDITNLQTTLNNAASAISANANSITAHNDRITALETKVGDGFSEITSAEIQALFEVGKQ